MAGKKSAGAGEGSKKAQGQARKAEAAAGKQAAKEREVAAREDEEWKKGGKDNSKKEAAAAKAAEAARKKAEKAALEKEEEASLPKGPKAGNAKKAEKKNTTSTSRGTLDLSQLDSSAASGADEKVAPALNATGIDNALDALSLTSQSNTTLDRHPERRFKAAYAAYEARRLEEMSDEKGLRRNQKIEAIRREFERSEENPFNQVSARYNARKGEVKEVIEEERRKNEERLVGSP